MVSSVLPARHVQPVTITLLNDPLAEGDLSVVVALTNAFAAYLGDPATAILTILDGRTNLPQADCRSHRPASPNPVMAGRDIVYTLLVYNAGPDYSSNVVVSDDLPAGTTFDGSSLATNSYDPALRQITIPIGDLAPGQTGVVTVAVLTSNVGPVVNVACVSSDTFDPNTNNNCASHHQHRHCGLAADRRGGGHHDQFQPGGIRSFFTYTITVTNSAPGKPPASSWMIPAC